MDQASPAQVADHPRTESASPDLVPPAPTPARDPGPTPTPPDPPRQETAETIRTDAARQFRGLRFALGCAVAVAITVILTAINVQSGRILDREGHGWTFRLLFGPDVIFGLTVAILLGTFIGTYSSIYISAPILVWLGVKPDSFLRVDENVATANAADGAVV